MVDERSAPPWRRRWHLAGARQRLAAEAEPDRIDRKFEFGLSLHLSSWRPLSETQGEAEATMKIPNTCSGVKTSGPFLICRDMSPRRMGVEELRGGNMQWVGSFTPAATHKSAGAPQNPGV